MPDYPELQPVSDQKRKRVLKREGMLKSMFEDRVFCMCMLGTLGTLGADLIYLMSNGKCTLRALLGQSPAECPAGQNPPPMNVLTGGHCL